MPAKLSPDFSCGSRPGSHHTFAHEKSGLELGFSLADEVDHPIGAVGDQEPLPECGIAQQATDTGEHLEMLGHAGGHQKEEEPDRAMIDGVVGDAEGMAANDDGRMFDQAGQGGAGVGDRDSIADACAVQFLAFLERAQQGLARFGPSGEFGQRVDQLAEDFVAMLTGELELDGAGCGEVGDTKAIGIWRCHKAMG
jgi:hypothetical protein